jgi:hypothetical protein
MLPAGLLQYAKQSSKLIFNSSISEFGKIENKFSMNSIVEMVNHIVV